MNDLAPKHEGRKLIQLLGTLGELEWQKATSSQYVSRIKGELQLTDQSTFPPTVCFRYKDEQASVISFLKDAVDQYKGQLSWAMVAYNRELLGGRNWVLGPKKVFEIEELAVQAGMSAKSYLSFTEPEFGPLAYADLEGLTAHMERAIIPFNI